MKLGSVTYNMFKDTDLPTTIQLADKLGLAALELRTTHRHGVEPTLSKPERAEVKQRFAAAKVRLLSYGTVCEFQSADHGVVMQQVKDCKAFVELARDTGALGVKVRPNGYVTGLPEATTNRQIGEAMRECGEYAKQYGVHIWMEVHGRGTQEPKNCRTIMEAANHPNVGICWNSNPTDVVAGGVASNFELLRPWIRNVHINELWNGYPYRELFGLLKAMNYQGYTLAEIQDNPQIERFMQYYKALWTELSK